ncbi:MAG TPA: signal peptidase I [Bryobacteraceae bacterium]|nr:signal peptidase I [Bryobacteraceae bacterium]
MPLIARIAAGVAFLMAAGSLISAVTGQIFALPFAFIPLAAGVGILRRRAWSAWGFSLYTLAQLVPLALVLARSSSLANGPPGAIGAVALAAVLIPLFFFAGRSMAAGPRGLAWPWITIAALTTVPLLFFQVFVVPSPTMENTLLQGDRLIVWRFPKTMPVRGEMIIFTYPVDRRQTFVKRVIGVPGDRIRISGKVLYRNGIAVNEPYAVHKTTYVDPYRDNFPSEPRVTMYDAQEQMLRNNVVDRELIVPAGKYFVLGDNRDNSLDSRYWGFLDARDIIGRPVMIYGSEDEAGPQHRIRWNRLFRFL